MKNFILLISIVFTFNSLFAQKISEQRAATVALNFAKHKRNENFRVNSVSQYSLKGQTQLYIVHLKPQGFVVMPVNENLQPVLAYSTEHNMPEEISNPEVRWLLDTYAKQVNYATVTKWQNAYNRKLWRDFENGIFKDKKQAKTVGPLLQTHWTQQAGFNAECPPGVQSGCVAIAMAQTLKYWNYPDTGANWNGYRHPVFSSGSTTYDWGYLHAYFSQTHYDWTNMQNDYATDAAAELVYHCGIAVNMFYTAWGAAASSADVPVALANYFRYSQDMQFVHRNEYTQAEWKQMLMDNLDLGYPIPYSGSGNSGGHEFVCDGYDDDTLFHLNLGWGGYADGYYEIDSINAGGYDFSHYNDALLNLHPANGTDEEFLWTTKLNGYQELYSYPKDIFPVNNKIIWTIPADGNFYDTVEYYQECAQSLDGGLNWNVFKFDTLVSSVFEPTKIQGFGKDTVVISLLSHSDTTSYKGVLIQSIDGGKHWQTKFQNTTSGFTNFYLIDNQHSLIIGNPVGGEFQIFVSSDFNENFTAIDGSNIPDALANEKCINGSIYYSNGTIWFATDKGRLFKSADQGQTWSVSTIYSSTDTLDISFAFDNEALDGLALVKTIHSDTVANYTYFSSTDGGTNWTAIGTPQNSMPSDIDYIPGTDKSFISVGGEFNDYNTHTGISISSDGGQTWTLQKQYYTSVWFRKVKMLSENKGFGGGYSVGYSVPHKHGFWVFGDYDLPLVADFSMTNSIALADSLQCTNTDIDVQNKSLGPILSYNWNFGENANPQTATGEGPFTVTYSSPGDKSVTLIVTGEYESDTAQTLIHVAESTPEQFATITGDSLVLLHSTETYEVPQHQYTFYTWTKDFDFWDGESDSNSIDIYFNGFAVSGDISVVAYNGCGITDTVIKTITVTTHLSENNNISDDLIVYPNPATNYFVVDVEENCSLSIIDNSGKIVKKTKLSAGKNTIYTQDLTQGIYQIKIEGKPTIDCKLIVKH